MNSTSVPVQLAAFAPCLFTPHVLVTAGRPLAGASAIACPIASGRVLISDCQQKCNEQVIINSAE